MRLYDRIQGAGFVSIWSGDPPGYVIEAMQGAARFDVTNVADYLDGFPDTHEWDLKDAPSLMMPFPTMWMEWQDGPARAAFLGRQMSEDREEVEQQFDLFMDARELHSVSTGRPLHIGSVTFSVSAEAGRYIPNSVDFILTEKLAQSSLWVNRIASKIPAASMSIAFLHCKNVGVEDAGPIGTRQQRRFEERRGIKPVQFKTLVIDPMKQVLKTEGGIEQHGLKKALHICRGHFATYSEDKPLFGKYSGTFWKPAHVRGSADVGMVGKDYKVKAPKQETR